MSHQRNEGIKTPKDEWQTPQWLFDLLDQEFHFDCDAAATPDNAKCKNYLVRALLCNDWMDETDKIFFLNPPYSAGNINRFMKKAYEESLKGAFVVCLVPVASDTLWWHDYAMKAQEIRFIRGRVKFVGYDEQGNKIKNSPTFSSCVVIFKQERRQDWENPRIGETILQPRKVQS